MDSNCYLFLLRWNKALPKTALEIASMIPRIPTSVVRGDSLEVPFMNFIKVDSVDHNIGGFGAGGAKDYSDLNKFHRGTFWHKEAADAQDVSWTAATTMRQRPGGSHYAYSSAGAAGNNWRWTGEPPMTEPGALRGSLPEQNHFSFSKSLDSATPQLAYGCTCQEQFKVALFYYRRKVAFNVASVQFPYMVIGLENVIIRDWSLNGDSETMKLSYDRICWGAVSQFGDTPVPQGISTRVFDRRSQSGGLVDASPLTGFVVGLTVAMYTAAWATIGAVTGDGVV